MTVAELEAMALRPRQPLGTVELLASEVLNLIADWREMRRALMSINEDISGNAPNAGRIVSDLKVKP